MPTLRTYSYALNGLDSGIQTLRGSHEIIDGQPVHVGRQRQLLMDWHVVDDLNGAYRTVHQPQKHPDNPVLRPQEPYEGTSFSSFGTVLREPDGNLFRLWLPVIDDRIRKARGTRTRQSMRGHYYESEDGVTWRRPKLGLYAHDGSMDNNIFVQSYTDNLFVLPLPQRMHARGRYAMVYCDILLGADVPNPERGPGHRNLIAFSDDGIHWRDAPENPIWCGRTDTGNNIVYNPDRDVFTMYRRATINAGEIRRIACSESRDLIAWTQPETIVRREENDPLHLYSMHVTPYHGVYLGMLCRLWAHPHHETCTLGNGRDYTQDTELAFSRDGLTWHRHPDKPAFIPTSPPVTDAYDWGGAIGMANILEMDDHVRVYYGGRAGRHGGGYIHPDDPRPCGLCLATLRRDGFVSVDAGADGGYMLTRPLALPPDAGRLHINARTAPDGFIRVAVREAEGVRDGEWPEAWRFDRAVPFSGDRLDHVVAWEHGNTLDAFGARTVRLHFWLENAELYSFRFGD